MNKFHLLSLFFFILAIIFFIFSFNSGNIQGCMFFIFPFVIVSGVVGFFVVIFLFLTFLFFIFGFFSRFKTDLDYPLEKPSETKSSKKFGGIIFIGPIPIIFGSSNLKIILFFVIVVLCILILYLLYFTFIK